MKIIRCVLELGYGMARAIFEIYDHNGKLTMDLSHNLTRILGVYVVTNRSGQIMVNKQQSERIFAYISIPPTNVLNSTVVQPIKYWIDNNVIHYECVDDKADLSRGEYQVIYGVY